MILSISELILGSYALLTCACGMRCRFVGPIPLFTTCLAQTCFMILILTLMPWLDSFIAYLIGWWLMRWLWSPFPWIKTLDQLVECDSLWTLQLTYGYPILAKWLQRMSQIAKFNLKIQLHFFFNSLHFNRCTMNK